MAITAVERSIETEHIPKTLHVIDNTPGPLWLNVRLDEKVTPAFEALRRFTSRTAVSILDMALMLTALHIRGGGAVEIPPVERDTHRSRRPKAGKWYSCRSTPRMLLNLKAIRGATGAKNSQILRAAIEFMECQLDIK